MKTKMVVTVLFVFGTFMLAWGYWCTQLSIDELIEAGNLTSSSQAMLLFSLGGISIAVAIICMLKDTAD